MSAAQDVVRFKCPHCDGECTAELERCGEAVECPHCRVPLLVPVEVALPVAASPPIERRFHFQCLRCGSVLEARSTMCGRPGRCPTCGGAFVVPQMDPRSGLAVSHADPGGEHEHPVPLHAYAAAGDKAPRIIRQPDDSLVIACPRCDQQSPIGANKCVSCHLPFTLEAAEFDVPTHAQGMIGVALALSVMGLPLSLCGGVGLAPGGIGAGLATFALLGNPASGRGQAIIALILGLLACAASLGVLALSAG